MHVLRLSILFLGMAAFAATDDTRGYLSALSDFLESHKLGDTELNRIIDGCEKGEMVNPILQSAADINPLTLVYREALQSWITPGKLNSTAVCEFAKSRLSDEARQKEEHKRAKENTVSIFDPTLSPSILSAASNYTCAIQHDNQVVCWGESIAGAHKPPHGLRAKSVVAGPTMACAIQFDDTLICWGDLNFGMSPRRTLGPVKSVAIGVWHACAVQLNNTVVCWGSNLHHQQDVPYNLGPVQSISAGANHTCAVRADNTLACWGSNDAGQLSALRKFGIISVSDGPLGTCAIDADYTLTCWGFPNNGSPPDPLWPIRLAAASRRNTCAIGLDNTFACWGDTINGITTPPDDVGLVKSVALGDEHVCIVRWDNTVSCWGNNRHRQLMLPKDLKVLSTEATP